MDSTIYSANLISLKKIQGRYTLRLDVTNLGTTISIDVHDSFCETLGISTLSTYKTSDIFRVLPRSVKVGRLKGFWEILNEGQILSNCLSKLL